MPNESAGRISPKKKLRSITSLLLASVLVSSLGFGDDIWTVLRSFIGVNLIISYTVSNVIKMLHRVCMEAFYTELRVGVIFACAVP